MGIIKIPNGWFDYKKIQKTTERILSTLNVPCDQITNFLDVISENCNLNNLHGIMPFIDMGRYKIIYYPRSEEDPDYGLGPILLIYGETSVIRSLLNTIEQLKLPVVCRILSSIEDDADSLLRINFKIAYHQQLEPTIAC